MRKYSKRKSIRNKSRRNNDELMFHKSIIRKSVGRKSKKQKHVRFSGGSGQCGNHVSLFNNKMVLGGIKKQKVARKKKGGSFSNFITNIVNPISFTTTSPTDQPAITNYYSSNATKI